MKWIYKSAEEETADLWILVCGNGSCINLPECKHTLEQMRDCQAMLEEESP